MLLGLQKDKLFADNLKQNVEGKAKQDEIDSLNSKVQDGESKIRDREGVIQTRENQIKQGKKTVRKVNEYGLTMQQEMLGIVQAGKMDFDALKNCFIDYNNKMKFAFGDQQATDEEYLEDTKDGSKSQSEQYEFKDNKLN